MTAMTGVSMNLYAILRRSAWWSGEEVEGAQARSKRLGEGDLRDEVRWIRTYVVEEGNGAVGTVCIYEATSPEAIRKHAALADLPVDKILAVTSTLVGRDDPGPVE